MDSVLRRDLLNHALNFINADVAYTFTPDEKEALEAVSKNGADLRNNVVLEEPVGVTLSKGRGSAELVEDLSYFFGKYNLV